MRMGLPLRIVAVFAAVLVPFAGAARGAGSEKSLMNVHGAVTYLVSPGGDAHGVAVNATVALNDDDVAKTGDQSMGAIDLPDSSRILLASNTTVKLDAFDAVDSTAHFVVFEGKMRFRVEHPQGAKASYTFTTPTGNVGVRGTEGDISADAVDGVRVNVYHLSDPSLPVQIDMLGGQHYDLPAGSKIWMRWKDGVLQGVVSRLTQKEVDRFSELGPPDGIDGGLPTPAPQPEPTYRP
jgi:ferric-dicitrate binding protein FerR (iron transport regulator)